VENGRVLWADVLAAVRRSNVVVTFSHIRGRPVIDRGRVFAVSYGGLLASIDLRSGRRIWEKEIASLDSPWVAGDFLYVLSTDGELICLSRKGGRVYWVQALPRYEDPEDREDLIIWTGPILTKNRLIVAGSHGEALAVSPYTGRILGREELPDGVSIPPVAASGSVYFLSDDAELTAYR
jgi:outer membrane protein assembly factor BamB